MQWVYGRSAFVRYVITKFSRMDSLPNFLAHGAPLRTLRARELRYKTIKCEKNFTYSSFTTYNPAVASPTEQLYEQMTSNPAVTKRNIQNSNAYPLNILVGR